MAAWRLDGAPPTRLVQVEETPAAPGPGEVQMRVAAASINYRDLGVLSAIYPAAPGIIPFSDGAGTIVATGPGVEGWDVGTPVVSCFYADWPGGAASPATHRLSFGCERDGFLADIVNVPVTGLVRKPDSLSFAEAATLPCAALTAWSALFTEARLQPGQHVVVQGTGGVAIFALQLAKLAGATVSLLSSSDTKLERGRSLGADHLVNYRAQPDWSRAVMDWTEGCGADLVVELGGPATLSQSLAAIRMEGLVAIVGLLSGVEAPLLIPAVLQRRARVHGITVGHRADMQALCSAVDRLGLRPVIDRCYSFADAPRAYQELPRGDHFGKLVVELPG